MRPESLTVITPNSLACDNGTSMQATVQSAPLATCPASMFE